MPLGKDPSVRGLSHAPTFRDIWADFHVLVLFLFMHENSYCFRRILAITILSVRSSHEWNGSVKSGAVVHGIGFSNFHRRLLGRLFQEP